MHWIEFWLNKGRFKDPLNLNRYVNYIGEAETMVKPTDHFPLPISLWSLRSEAMVTDSNLPSAFGR